MITEESQAFCQIPSGMLTPSMVILIRSAAGIASRKHDTELAVPTPRLKATRRISKMGFIASLHGQRLTHISCRSKRGQGTMADSNCCQREKNTSLWRASLEGLLVLCTSFRFQSASCSVAQALLPGLQRAPLGSGPHLRQGAKLKEHLVRFQADCNLSSPKSVGLRLQQAISQRRIPTSVVATQNVVKIVWHT